jgi:hypothetical protein
MAVYSLYDEKNYKNGGMKKGGVAEKAAQAVGTMATIPAQALGTVARYNPVSMGVRGISNVIKGDMNANSAAINRGVEGRKSSVSSFAPGNIGVNPPKFNPVTRPDFSGKGFNVLSQEDIASLQPSAGDSGGLWTSHSANGTSGGNMASNSPLADRTQLTGSTQPSQTVWNNNGGKVQSTQGISRPGQQQSVGQVARKSIIGNTGRQQLGNLDVQFDKSMSLDERGRFAESALKERHPEKLAQLERLARYEREAMAKMNVHSDSSYVAPPHSNTLAGELSRVADMKEQRAISRMNNETDRVGLEAGRNGLTARGQDIGAIDSARSAAITSQGQVMDYASQNDRNEISRQQLLSDLQYRQAQTANLQEEGQMAMDNFSNANNLKIEQERLASLYGRGASSDEITRQQNRIAALGGQVVPRDSYGVTESVNTIDGEEIKTPIAYNKNNPRESFAIGGQDKPQAPQAAIDALKKNPNMRDEFKAKYGFLPAGY